MNRYWPLLSKLKRFHNRYCDPQISWRNDIALCQGRNRGQVFFTPYSICAENLSCPRYYSGLGVNTIPAYNDEIHPDGVYGRPQNFNDIDNLGESSPRVGSVNYRQNTGQFQHQYSPTTHHATSNLTSSPYVGHHTTEKIEGNLQHTQYSKGEGTAPVQQSSNHTQMNAQFQQNSCNMYVGNRVAYPPGAYQQEQVDTRSNRNTYQEANAGASLQNSSGYYNVRAWPQHQNFSGSHNPNVLSQPSPAFDGSAEDDDEKVEGTLEELEALCKEWDLGLAVKSMRKLSERGSFIDMPHYLMLIDACRKTKALQEARVVHQHLVKFSSPVNISIFNKILEMYGECGSMEDAYKIFNSMLERNLTSWDTMITWLAKNGLGEDAIDMFTKFKEAGLKPDGPMFLGIFDACGVLGDVTEGLLHFDSMTKIYGITPTMAHYASIVHMFGSAGDLDGAIEFIEKMPVEPSVDVWESLMNIARVQGNIEIGDRCAQIVKQLDPARLSKELKDGLLPVNDAPKKKKRVKRNLLEHTKHEYRAGDRSHPENDKIYTVLRGIKESVKEAGYIPETKFVLHDIDPESKEEAIMAHSERLACTYALITSGARMPLRIIKNLRVCGDCHNYFKIISSLVGREIVMRDAKRYHHFKDGKCSCNDYW